MRVRRAARYGLCAGVRVAVRKARQLVESGRQAVILGQVVHNERLVRELEDTGLRSIDSLAEADKPTIVFSAHGVPPSYHRHARAQGLEILDTTCTFVYDIHRESQRALAGGCHLVFIGDPSHREVIGYTHDLDPGTYHAISTLEEAQAVDWSQYSAIVVFFQTTLNAGDYQEVVRHIERANPHTRQADTVCYATRENQQAARQLAEDDEVDLVLVIGGRSSANTRHLLEITARHKPSYLIQGAADIDPTWLRGVRCVGLTAGASTPDDIIDEVENHLQNLAL